MATQAKIDIKSAGGTTLLSTSINEGAKGYYSLMQHDYIVLPFKLRTPIDFKIGSYVDLRGVFDDALGGKLAKMYYVTELQNPSYNTSTGAYEYQLRLNAYYWLWNNFIFKYTPESTAGEASWSLTAPLDVQLGVFLRNLSELGFTYNGVPYEYSIDSTVENKAVAMTYDNTRLLDALFLMGGENAWDCDVWVTENVIHFGRCEHGDAVKIEIGVEASDMTRNESRGTFATRIYAFGSTRNIPENYREASNPDLTVNGIVQKRLMLPADTPYIDAYPDMQPFEVVESVVVFDDIYPKRIGTLSDVKTVDRAIEDGEGNQTGTFKAYQYKDTGLTFDEEYILEGQELRIVFQSGRLNGLDFGVTFNPNGTNPAEQLWEIVANEDYGRRLPDEVMKPENGDKYILYGFDIKLVSDQYTPEAEQDLKERAQAYVNKTKVDDGTYTVPLRASYVREDMISRTYDVGQKVNLVNPFFFGTEGRISRVIGWEMCLDIPSDNPVYTIGESAQYSRLTEIEDKVDSLVFNGQTYQGTGGGSGVYVIRTNDSTPASDSNVFSALRSLATFLRKDKADSTRYLLKLLGGAEFGAFTQGLLGTGGAVTIDEDGNSHAEFDYLTIRKIATFIELLIQEAKSVGGMIVVSPSNMKVSKVEETDSAYRCYFEKTDGERTVLNQFEEGDQARRQTFNLETGQAYYWRLVTSVGDDYVDLSKTDCDTGSTVPQAGDEIVGIGNRTNKSRQSAIIISAYGDGSPSIRYYQGIDSYSLTGKAVKEDYYDLSTGRFKTVTYGDSYVGDREGNTFMKYDQENGVEVKGKVSMSSGSTGWENLEGLSGVIKDVSDAASAAQNAADNAQDAADNAQADAESANNRLDQWAEDGVISPTEKLALKQELENLQSEYDTNIQNAQKYGIDTSAYTSAWTTYRQELEYHSQDTPENITIKETFATSRSSFYKSREDLLVSIADAAKEYADKLVSSVSVGTENLLLNTGFTGNYDPKVLSASTPLNKRTYMYSNRLENWSGAGTVNEDESSESGYSCSIGSISQSVSLIEGERYVISYKAKGSSVTVSIGSNTWTDSLSSSYSVYSHKFEYSSGSVFAMAGSADVCEIKLERGTIPTDWCPSRKDTNEVADMFKQYWYLKDAMNGSTDVIGGLVLTSMIQLGKWTDGVMEKVNAGISGIYNEDTDVAFWAGGTFEQAIATVRKIIGGENPSDEEWKSLAKFVATHGGDIFLRGYIYALGGVFRGTVYAEGGEFRGKFETSLNGQRIVIDPEDGSLKMLDEDGRTAVNISFSNNDGRMTAGLMITEYEGDTAWFSTRILGRSVTMVNNLSNYGAILLPDQIRFLSGGSELFSLSMSQDYTTGGKKVLITGSNWNETEGLAGTVYVDENGFLKVSKKEPVQPGA